MYIFSPNPDVEFYNLRNQGYLGSIPDMQFKFLRELGHKGSLCDMFYNYLAQDFSSSQSEDSSDSEDGINLSLEIGIGLD